jgi:hypothetical protein
MTELQERNHFNCRLKLTAEEKEEVIRRLQRRELEWILRKLKEEESTKTTSRSGNHIVQKSAATQTGRETRQEDSPEICTGAEFNCLPYVL